MPHNIHPLIIDKMNKRGLDFIMAYADVYGMKDWPVQKVYNQIITFYNEGKKCTEGEFNFEEYINEFLEKYNSMKEHHLDDEVKRCIASGDDFFTACSEWDI